MPLKNYIKFFFFLNLKKVFLKNLKSKYFNLIFFAITNENLAYLFELLYFLRVLKIKKSWIFFNN